MAKIEQTRTLFLDADGISRDFERWSYKRISTAKTKTVELMRMIWSWKKKDLIKSGVVCVSFGIVDPDCKDWNDYTEKERISLDEFIKLVET